MKTWKNRNRRSKKRKQRGGVRLTPEQKVEYTRIRDEVNRKLAQIPPEHNSSSAKYLKSTISSINQFLKPMFDAQTRIIKDDSNTLSDVDSRYEVYKTQEQLYNTEYGIVPAPAPVAPAPPPLPLPVAPRVGKPVYNLNAPAAVEGQPRTIADCNRMLAEARAQIAELEGRLGVETGRLEGVTKEREAQVARLNSQIAEKEKEVNAVKATEAALRGEKGGIQAELERIQGQLAETSEVNETLTRAIGQSKGDIQTKDASLGTLRNELATLKEASQAAIDEKSAEILRIREQHRAELADTNGRYQADLEKLRADLARVEGEKTGTAAEKDKIKAEKDELEAQIAAFEARIAELTRDLGVSEEARNKEAGEKAAAAEAARVAAAAEAAKLDTATREGQGLRQRLAAAEGAREMADRAARDAVAARGAAEAAKRAADGRVVAAEREAEEARRAAEAALADKGVSDGEKDTARREAQAAEAARAQAVRDAAARADAAAGAAAAAAAANGQLAVIQARLDDLENSVPTIDSITAADGARVGGGDGGRSAIYGEPLTVTWNVGAAPNRDTWVFVMFATVDGRITPVYSQLVLNNQPFTFTSTVSGPVQAVVYDVVSHSRGNGAGQINF